MKGEKLILSILCAIYVHLHYKDIFATVVDLISTNRLLICVRVQIILVIVDPNCSKKIIIQTMQHKDLLTIF